MKTLFRYCFLILILNTLFGIKLFAQADITAMEYFIDTDPGVGLATAIPITTGTGITESFIVPTSSLGAGFHTIYFRVFELDSNRWSVSESRSFYISPTDIINQADVVAVEYFIDTDPGYGAGISLPVSTATTVNISSIIPTAALAAGFHNLHIRALDADGIWGNLEIRSFYIRPDYLATQADIVTIEYFIDTDPGYGAGTSLALTAATTVNLNPVIPTATLASGFHTLYLRALDADGLWGEIESRSFFIDNATQGKIASIEYFFDNDPGYGNGSTITINPPKDSIDSVLNVPSGALAVGTHQLGVRLVAENGIIGITDYYDFNLCDGAVAKFVADPVCIGGTTLLIDNSLNVVGGDVYSWDFDGDGLEDASTPGVQSFTYPNPGVYNASLSIDRLGCIGADTVQVVVESIPISDAGTDQSICVGNTILDGSMLGTNETGNWSILTGTAVIVNPADSVSALNNITTNTVELIWAVTNTLAGCSDEDTVNISINLPILAALINESVDIGQTLNIDVQSLAVVNADDNLTTAIITVPLYGMASLLADGTIDYIPDLDAAAVDSLVYRITNQCNNFDDSQLMFTVINAPPVIDTQGATANVGSTEITIDIAAIISDPNGNIDFSSIIIVTQPMSGAIASLDVNGILELDYRGITFSGTDQLDVQVCDLVGICTIETINIPNVEVGGTNPPITVFNGVSPDNDGHNDFLEIENIEFYPDNLVIILNRWGEEIDRYQGYNNQDIVFKNTALPSGTYYYHIIPGVEGVKEVTGHFLLKID